MSSVRMRVVTTAPWQDYAFDPGRMLAREGNTSVSILYAYSRIAVRHTTTD